METQNSELILKEDLAFTSDTYELEFEGNSENQIMVLNPYEDEGVIYESSKLINKNHVPSVAFDENLQHPCQYLCDKEYEDDYSYVSSDYSFDEFLFQEQTCEDQNEVPVEVHAKRFLDIHHAHELDVVVQEHTNSFYDVDDLNDKKSKLLSFILKVILKLKV